MVIIDKINFNGKYVDAMKVETVMTETESDGSVNETKDTVWYVPAVKRSVMTKTELKDSSGFSSTILAKVLSYDLY